ncbi:hypothetical protein PUN28_007145 [Cardiocondyla obscurior]|uniref:Uncharacterized protein n=1 Tax=Cardiocondyla obscurior TaxID=286306 RepID=A0AAW2G2D0_9HYME
MDCLGRSGHRQAADIAELPASPSRRHDKDLEEKLDNFRECCASCVSGATLRIVIAVPPLQRIGRAPKMLSKQNVRSAQIKSEGEFLAADINY